MGTFDPETSVWVHVILNTKLQTTGIQKSAYSFALHLNINNNCWMAFIFCTQGWTQMTLVQFNSIRFYLHSTNLQQQLFQHTLYCKTKQMEYTNIQFCSLYVCLSLRKREKARERMWVSLYKRLSWNILKNEGERLQQQQLCPLKSQRLTVNTWEALRKPKTQGHTCRWRLSTQIRRGKRKVPDRAEGKNAKGLQAARSWPQYKPRTGPHMLQY